jgi:uncharacterized protein
MNILMTGGTGLIGKKLGLELCRRGYTLIGITRNKKQAELLAPYPATWLECDIGQSAPNLNGLQIDGVVHLAGENVGEKNWSQEQKQKILKSRTQGTKNLQAALKGHRHQFFIGASAIGLYQPNKEDEWLTEYSPSAQNFLADVTKAWEHESSQIPQEVRSVLFRIGVVLSTQGGALPKMLFPAQIFASSPLGSGKQWLSWIHLNDVVKAFIEAIEKSQFKGIYNLVAPEPARQKQLALEIAKSINGFSGPPVPGFLLKTILGEQASLALQSMRVSSQKLSDQGFVFEFKSIDTALSNILKDWRDGVAVKTYQQFFPQSRTKVFPFFAAAENLEKITPETLNFHIVKMSTPQIEKGTLLDYKLKIHGIPVSWRTRIETWRVNEEFTDTQLKGPYSLWHHTHSFEDLAGGTLMTDVIRYKLPLGLVGRLFAQAWVDNDVENIFSFRRKVVGKLI